MTTTDMMITAIVAVDDSRAEDQCFIAALVMTGLVELAPAFKCGALHNTFHRVLIEGADRISA